VIVDRAANPEQARHFRRMLWLSAVAFPVMTAWIAYDLQQLENDIVSEVTIWAPVAAVYDHFGYWPAVLVTPLVGILCCTVFLFKLTKLTAQDDSQISM
jgi:hypothetical protein